MKLQLFVLCLFGMSSYFVSSQIITSNGGTINVNNGGVLHLNGGMLLSNSSVLTNNGNISVTKNSTLVEPGNFILNSNTTVSGSGVYNIEQDWINDATFNADNSEVELFGNTEQLITSNNGTNTTFNRLTLSGNGTGVNRRKTLVNVDAEIAVSGELNLNNREFNTNTRILHIQNPSVSSVSFDNTYNNEGFVSSLPNGFMIREMNQSGSYLFPVGSSDGTRRFRPIIVESGGNQHQTYATRMNNFSPDSQGFPLTQKEESISEANSKFYHSVRSLTANSNANLLLFFDPNKDSEWESIAHWSTSEIEWKDIESNGINSFSNYKYSLKSNWSFPIDNDEYVLINSSYRLDIPNVLTPNGDNVNDEFYVVSNGLTEYHIQILNRWGNPIFESDDVNEPWTGHDLNQNECTDGVYFYIIKAKYKDKEIQEHGHITLIKK